MEKIFEYRQNRKTDKGKCVEDNVIEIFHSDETLLIDLGYYFTYRRPKEINVEDYQLTREVENINQISLNLKNADFHVFSSITNRGFLGDTRSASPKRRKNKFSQLSDITNESFFRGTKSAGSVRYSNKAKEAWVIIKDILQSKMTNEYLKSKDYNKPEIDPLYDLIVDFHLDKKNIKGHNMVYLDVQEDFPKQKYLKTNDRKFVPALLEQYGIKNRQFVSALSNNEEGMPVIIKTLNYFCKLFGENYIDYMNKIDWEVHCYCPPPTNKVHPLKNEQEKRNMVKVIQSWEEGGLRTNTDMASNGSLVTSLHTVLELRDKIENRGIDLKFQAKHESDFDRTFEEWRGLKKYLTVGYKIRYSFPDEFIKTIEQPIRIGDVIFKPVILKLEEDFKIEGHLMKNCMGGQFSHGSIAVFISLRKDKKWIDVQYARGEKIMSYAKANSPIPDGFQMALKVLNKRMKEFKDVKWIKEKYDPIGE